MRSGLRRQTEVAVIAATQMGRLIVTRAIRLVPVSHVHLIASAELMMVRISQVRSRTDNQCQFSISQWKSWLFYGLIVLGNSVPS